MRQRFFSEGEGALISSRNMVSMYNSPIPMRYDPTGTCIACPDDYSNLAFVKRFDLVRF